MLEVLAHWGESTSRAITYHSNPMREATLDKVRFASPRHQNSACLPETQSWRKMSHSSTSCAIEANNKTPEPSFLRL